MRLGVSAALVEGAIVPGDVRIADGLVAEVGVQPAGDAGLAAPGFVDAHVNGIAGVDFLTTEPDAYREAALALAATGVVGFQPTFVSAEPEAYRVALASAATAQAELAAASLPALIGVHLEGPFLSPKWPGAHDHRFLRAPDQRLAEELCDAGPVTMMTLAPELEGGLDLIGPLVAGGVVVSCGHTDADAGAAHAAFNHGATAITHIYNAHRRWRPRDPGPAGAALVRPEVFVEAIVDGVHLAPEAAFATFLATDGRFCLVTDAVEAATLGPGSYRLGGRSVELADGAVRLADGTLAGSVLTMDHAVRNLVGSGAPVPRALHAAATAPARLLGRDDLGALTPGAPASLVVLDAELRVARTLVRGVEAFAA